VGVGGHGMLLAPSCPCRIAHLDNGTLLFGLGSVGADGTAIVAPGTSPATSAPAPVAGEPRVFVCGEDGPRIALDAGGIVSLDEVFLQVDVGLGESPWVLLGPGFMLEHPARFTVFSAAADDADPLFELHPGTPLDPDELIRLQFVGKPASAVQIRAPGGNALVEGESPGEREPVRTWQLSYEREGEEWVQRQYALPMSPEMAVVMSAQAPRRSWAAMESAAELIAATFGPLAE